MNASQPNKLIDGHRHVMMNNHKHNGLEKSALIEHSGKC